jgi:hypothetical protein
MTGGHFYFEKGLVGYAPGGTNDAAEGARIVGELYAAIPKGGA